ncbi:MAG: hypothetical protein RLN82_11160, partial [Pseudomonadales bacterium]
VAGALFPSADAYLWGDSLEMTGIFLLLSLMPPYLLMCFLASLRSSLRFHEALQTLVEDADNFLTQRFRYARYWPIAVLLGAVYGMAFNVFWPSLEFSEFGPRMVVSVALVFGQLFMWCIVGLVLFFRLHEGWLLHRVAAKVKIDLYNLDVLNGFGRESLNNFLMIVGALALTTVQSLNQRFEISNYMYALLVGIPAAMILVPLPLIAIHRRIRAAKKIHLQQINREIVVSSRQLDNPALTRMNALLQRREQIQSMRNWPMDLSIVWRFVLYVFIVPLAWAGAAFTEVFLDAILGL